LCRKIDDKLRAFALVASLVGAFWAPWL